MHGQLLCKITIMNAWYYEKMVRTTINSKPVMQTYATMSSWMHFVMHSMHITLCLHMGSLEMIIC